MSDVTLKNSGRPLQRSDAADMLDLLREMDAAETGNSFTTEADVFRILDNNRTDLNRDSRVVSDRPGLAGFATVETLTDREHVRATLGLRPDIADAAAPLLLDWAEQRAQEIAVGLGWASAIAVTWQLPGGLAEPTLRRRGWAAVRRFNHLQGDLLHPAPKVPAAPPGAVVYTATTDQQARQVHDVLEIALADHWEHRPKTADRFLADERAATRYDQSLWFLATIDGDPAAAIIARILPDQGWIGWFGTHPVHRGKGLGRLLLTTAMAELARRGCTRVGLDVDTGNQSGALRLYESAGLEAAYQADQWRLTAPAGA